MDVTTWTSDVPVSRKYLEAFPRLVLVLGALLLSGVAADARAQVSTRAVATNPGSKTPERPLHWSGDKTRILRKENQVELIGNAAVHQPGESMTAEYILLDLNERTLHAKGNCVYITVDTVMQGEEMRFNLDTHTGTIVGGRVSNSHFTLTGERINKLGDQRFQTHRGEYTTCRDCPGAWSLRADDVDLEFEGYARMTGVTPTIKDAPIFWLPYFIVPLKTKRQTGFLFPQLGFTEKGFRYVQPFFWVIGRSADMTIGLGNFGGHGKRLELEARYKLKGRSGGTANFFYLDDQQLYKRLVEQGESGAQLRRGRTAISVSQLQQLPYGIEQKFRLIETSDNLYPSNFADVPGNNEAYLASDLIFTGGTDQVNVYVAARRFRNLIYLDSSIDTDPATVQEYPTAGVTTNDRDLLGSVNLRGGLTLGFTNFSRRAGSYDFSPFQGDRPASCLAGEFCEGVDAIREASRLSITPAVYRPFRPWDTVSIVPSFEYRAFFYDFKNNVPNLARGYGLARIDLSTRLEKIYETGNAASPRLKHVIQPMLSYSLIPIVQAPHNGHPFLEQIEYGRTHSVPNWYFDSNDIVPLDQTQSYANYFTPLGNSLTYGFSTQLIRRDSPIDSDGWNYHRSLEWRANQSFNFREFRHVVEKLRDPEPLSRISSSLLIDIDHVKSQLDYVYQPYVEVQPDHKRHVLSANLTYTFETASRPGYMSYERSVGLSYYFNKLDRSPIDNISLTGTFSVSDYFQPSASISYNLIDKRITEFGSAIRYQSPSRCWGVLIGAAVTQCPSGDGTVGYCVKNPKVNLQINLTGDGLAGISELTSAKAKP